MPTQQHAILGDGIEMTGIRRVPRTQYRLPPPSKGSEPPADTIVISSDDEAQEPAMKRQKVLSSSSSKRKYPGAAPMLNRRPLHIDLTLFDDSPEEVQPPRKRIKRPKPPQNDTKENPIMVMDSDDGPQPPQNDTKENPIMVMDSDDEPQPIVEDADSDSDYENIHGGYNVGWSTSAADRDENIFDIDLDMIGDAVAKLSLGEIRTRLVSHPCRLAPVSQAGPSSRNADLAYRGSTSFPLSLESQRQGPLRASYRGGRARTGLLRHRPPQIQSPLVRLKLLTRFQMADACHSIAQSSAKVLFASSTPGGTMDDEVEGSFTVDPYNSRETFAIWNEEFRQKWLPAHYVNSYDPGIAGGPSQRRKFYDVKCAKFDPTNPDVFASTGLDGTLTVWNSVPPIQKTARGYLPGSSSEAAHAEPRARYEPVKKWGKETYGGHSCHDIVYRRHNPTHGNSLLAAPCDNGTIFVHSYTPTCDSFTVLPLKVASHAAHRSGASVWGHGSTSKELFVCSEADGDSPAYHGAFDFSTGELLYHFDDRHSGEEIALNPEGSIVALFTAAEDNIHLRLYDAGRHDPHRIVGVTLPPASNQLHPDAWPEVRSVAWSPDGILLAVGGNDDVAHVYDVRCLGRGPVLSLTHEARSSRYGITVLSWTSETCFRSPSLGLLTGGGDHCIALWDMRTACEERQVLAELHGDVGVAHFGDLSRGEKPLVAGDTDGHVYIYDFFKRQEAQLLGYSGGE